MNPYLIDTSISNKTHQKMIKKLIQNPQEKSIHLFKYNDVCFFGLIGLLLLWAYYIGAIKLLMYYD
jgi:hypothetical protein